MSLDRLSKFLKDRQPVDKRNHVLLIDGLNTFIRSFSVSPHMNEQGMHIGGLTGFLKSIGAITRDMNADEVVIVFDGKDGSKHRRKIFPGYKGNRKVNKSLNRAAHMTGLEDPDKSMKRQLMRLVSYMTCLPVRIITVDGIEADDSIAYIAQELIPQDSRITIYSSDKDFFQLINDRIKVYAPHAKGIIDEDELFKKFGVYPINYIHYKAFLGDSSDNVPGILGFGKKTVLKYFPELGGTEVLERDYFVDKANELKAISKKGVRNAYQKFLDSLDQYDVNIKIMDLENPIVPGNSKTTLRRLMQKERNSLDSGKFILMLREDEISKFVEMPSVWLRNTWGRLNS